MTVTKLSEDRYRSLLDYIGDGFANLVFSFNTPVGENYRKNRPGQDIAYIEFLFLDRYLLGSPARIDTIASLILSDPHRQLKRIHVNRPPAAVTRTDASMIEQLVLAPHRLARVGERSLAAQTSLARRFHASTGRFLFPTAIRSEERCHTFDTRENRFIKFFLEQLVSRTSALRKVLAAENDGYLNPEMGQKLQVLERGLTTLLSASLWQDVGRMAQVPANSQVLQRKEGYRQLFRLYCLLYLMTECQFDALDFKNILETKNIAQLYEYWSFFVVKEILDRAADPISTSPIIDSDPREQKVVVGYRIEYSTGVVLYYNRNYASPEGSYSHAMRPDIVITRNGQGMVFDAKFKLGSGGSFSWDDINKMHAYRDALDGITTAFILYPGLETDPALFRAPDGVSDYHGVGAFPLAPGAQGLPSEAQARQVGTAIEDFIGRS